MGERRTKDETRRLATLRSSAALKGAATPPLDEVTRVARQLFDTEIAAMSLVEERHQYFAGSADRATVVDRDVSFCARAIEGDDVMVVPDASRDPRFVDHPMVSGHPNVRFYAGAPVSTRNGSRVGALCVLGQRPREASPEALHALHELGRVLEREIQSFEAASFDPLTGLTNRSGLLSLGEEMLQISRASDEGAAVLVVAVEGVDAIGDRFGADAADDAVRDMARLLEGNFRASDLVARVGDEAFCVVMAPYSDATDEFRMTRRVRQAVDAYNESAGVPWTLGVSLGAARDQPGIEFERLIELADARLAESRMTPSWRCR